VESANELVSAFAAARDMPAAVAVLEEAVAAGVTPQGGTVAALIGGCQRVHACELAFQVCLLQRVAVRWCGTAM
jgi:hypothetical protein